MIEMDTTKNKNEMSEELLTNTLCFFLCISILPSFDELGEAGVIEKLTKDERNKLIQKIHTYAEKKAKKIISKQKKVK